MSEKHQKYLISIPPSHIERLDALSDGRFENRSSYIRYLIRQEILRHGVLPAVKPSRTGTSKSNESTQKTAGH
jgi:metal-responsive CopG/Arc/MetJ family transcriptional regulator